MEVTKEMKEAGIKIMTRELGPLKYVSKDMEIWAGDLMEEIFLEMLKMAPATRPSTPQEQ